MRISLDTTGAELKERLNKSPKQNWGLRKLYTPKIEILCNI